MGQVLREGNVADIQNDPEVIEVYIGRGHEEETVEAEVVYEEQEAKTA
jgi:hypothetical protein